MEPVIFTEHLIQRGYTATEIQRRRRRGDLSRIRPGAYVASAETLSPVPEHRRLVAATVPQLSAGAAVSYTSAAVLHGLPVWRDDLRQVQLTRPRTGGGGKRRPWVRMHAQPLEPADLTVIDGVQVTSLARTVFDLARTLRYERAVAAGDRALALGMSSELLAEMLERGRAWRGIAQARRTAGFIDGRAQSAGESVSRVQCVTFGLPPPTPQLAVRLANGSIVYGDLGWEECRTIGEFDGRVKYLELVPAGEQPSDVVIREKRREDRLRALGWQIVRWLWEDLRAFGPVAQQLLAAFERGRRLTVIS